MTVTEIAFPALVDSCERQSAESQREFFQTGLAELASLVLAALAAVVPGQVGGGVSVILFVVAIALRLSGKAEKAEARWYEARAGAESIKSMAWQFAVGGESFRLADLDAEDRFRTEMLEVLDELKELDVAPPKGGEPSVTGEMRAIRRESVAQRRAIYLAGRVRDQQDWYSQKSEHNKDQAKFWRRNLVAIEFAAVLLGLARAFGWFDIDLLGVGAALGAGIAAWLQMKKYGVLATSYALTAHEVGLLSASVEDAQTESTWAQAVHDAEAAFSREHTTWLARRQGPLSDR